MKRNLGALIVSVLLAISKTATADTWNAAADFAASNPNNAWSYGWSSSRGSGFNTYPSPPSYDLNGMGGFISWHLSLGGLYRPHVTLNTGSSALSWWQVGQLGMHPGPHGENSIVRWTALGSGTFWITATFSRHDPYGNTDVAVLRGNQTLFSGIVAGAGSTQGYGTKVALQAGDTIDFTIGSNGPDSSDSTRLEAVISTVAPVIHVSPTGNDSNNGLTWDQAKATVNSALSVAGPNAQVWVAAGTYSTHAVLNPGAELYGGFTGTESSLSQRNPTANVTTLDGGGSGTILYVAPDNGSPQTADGFTVTHGESGIFVNQSSAMISNNRVTDNTNAWNSGISGDHCSARVYNNYVARNTGFGDGGGMLFTFSTPDIEGNTITLNTGRYGGAINFYQCTDTKVIGNTMIDNTATFIGGIIVNDAGGIMTIIGNTFSGNHSLSGGAGGLQIGGVDRAIVTDNTITGNRSDIDIGGFNAGGFPIVFSRNIVSNNVGIGVGGVVIVGTSDATIDSNTISGNASNYIGGAGFDNVLGSLTNNTISSNSGDRFGGAALTLCNLTVSGNIISDNTSLAGTGGVFLNATSGSFTRNQVVRNHGAIAGGILDAVSPAPLLGNLIGGNTSDTVGGGLFLWYASPTIANNVFSSNRAQTGAAIYVNPGSAPRIVNNTIVGNNASGDAGGIAILQSSPIVANNIVAYNLKGGISQTSDASATLSHNCLIGNTVYNYGPNVAPGVGDIQADPQFNNPLNVLSLKNTSPCLESGDDSFVDLSWTDYVGNIRIRNLHVDIGAYEFQGKPKSK